MAATAPAAPAPHPVIVIRTAVAWARARGLRVRIGEFGIRCASAHGAERWEPDNAGAIDPVACAVLHAQPEATDPFAAAAEALAAPESWVRAFCAGLAREDFTATWAESVHRKLAAAGYEAGLRFRFEFHRGREGVA